MATGKKKILILMSDTGGGHRASAQAIVDALDELYPGAVRGSCWHPAHAAASTSSCFRFSKGSVV
jgi:hypothetical protein